MLQDEIAKRKAQALAAMPKYNTMWVGGHEISMLETEGEEDPEAMNMQLL